jgi:hypothetical protein
MVLHRQSGKTMQDNLNEMLQALAQNSASRSETARLKDVFDSVEQAIKAGVSRQAVLDTLRGQGFTMTLKSFESALYRIRKQRAKQAQPAAPQNASTQTLEQSGNSKKITNPAHIREALKRDIDLDDYSS